MSEVIEHDLTRCEMRVDRRYLDPRGAWKIAGPPIPCASITVGICAQDGLLVCGAHARLTNVEGEWIRTCADCALRGILSIVVAFGSPAAERTWDRLMDVREVRQGARELRLAS